MNDPHALARVWRSDVVCNVTVYRVLLTSYSVVLGYCVASLRNANKSERMFSFLRELTPRSPRPSPPSHPPPCCSWSAAVLGAYLPLHERKTRLKHASDLCLWTPGVRFTLTSLQPLLCMMMTQAKPWNINGEALSDRVVCVWRRAQKWGVGGRAFLLSLKSTMRSRGLDPSRWLSSDDTLETSIFSSSVQSWTMEILIASKTDECVLHPTINV